MAIAHPARGSGAGQRLQCRVVDRPRLPPVATTSPMAITQVTMAVREKAISGMPVSTSGAMPIATVSYIACISATTGTDSRDPLNTNVMITLTAMSWIVLTAMYASGASALPASATQ